jgi:phosphohistidine swiveling domain-containing protein
VKYVLFQEEVRPDSPIGGKARALAALTWSELPVPAWFAVLPAALHASVPSETLVTSEHGDQVVSAPARLSQVRLAPEVMLELESALEKLGGKDEVFAVRSSATDEDSARLSFAGQLESFLFVPRGEVAARIAAVWASGFSERLMDYRRSVGADLLASTPAVIVQRMIDGDASGVAFSADPVSGRRTVAVVAAVPGLASALVSGEAEADTWHVDRNGQILKRAIEAKHVRHQRRHIPGGGIEAVPVNEQEELRPAIDDSLALRVAELSRRAERHFARPQDIEWTTKGGELYLLQSRPITTLADLPDPDAPRALWDNSNIIESYGGITTPLTFSFARRAYEHVYREFCRLIRVPEDVIESHSAMFSCMLGLIRGRVYYNLYNWYRLVAVLPGYRFNRRFMEQMMGVRESLPDDIATAQTETGNGARWRDAWRLTVSVTAFARHLITLPRRMERFYQRLREALGSSRPDLSSLRPDELVAYYRDLEQRLLVRWDAPIVNDFATMIFHGLLRRLSGAWIKGGTDTVHNDLLCAEPGMISEEPAARVAEMATLAARDAALVATLCDGILPAIRSAVSGNAQLDQAIRAYIDRFGDRCMEELKLESSTLHDDPTPLYRAIGHYAANIASHTVRTKKPDLKVRQDAEARAATALAGHPVRRLAFMWILKRARACVVARENLRLERTRVFGRARQILLEMGKRLAAVDCLTDSRDVFYLELDELLAFVEARATTTDLKGLVKVRQAEFAGYRDAPVPADRFETRGLVYRGHDFAGAAPVPLPHGETLQGLGCCPGIVRGSVRVVRDPRSASVKRGEILVAERTDPGWVMIFPGAAGLLVERGSLLSHSAIVARELGLPAIVSLPGLTHWLRDGDRVEMDGSTGRVVKLDADESASTTAG